MQGAGSTAPERTRSVREERMRTGNAADDYSWTGSLGTGRRVLLALDPLQNKRLVGFRHPGQAPQQMGSGQGVEFIEGVATPIRVDEEGQIGRESVLDESLHLGVSLPDEELVGDERTTFQHFGNFRRQILPDPGQRFESPLRRKAFDRVAARGHRRGPAAVRASPVRVLTASFEKLGHPDKRLRDPTIGVKRHGTVFSGPTRHGSASSEEERSSAVRTSAGCTVSQRKQRVKRLGNLSPVWSSNGLRGPPPLPTSGDHPGNKGNPRRAVSIAIQVGSYKCNHHTTRRGMASWFDLSAPTPSMATGAVVLCLIQKSDT